MPYEKAPQGRTPSFDYGSFHADLACNVELLMGPTSIHICCTTCKVLAQLEAVSIKVDNQASKEVRQP